LVIIQEKKLNDHQAIKKILTTLNRRRYFIFLLLSFLAGCLLTGFLLYRPRPGAIGILDKRFNSQYARAAETTRRLEEELKRERELNRQLREHNQRAREIAGGLTETTNRLTTKTHHKNLTENKIINVF
jgi:hypothetical protein